MSSSRRPRSALHPRILTQLSLVAAFSFTAPLLAQKSPATRPAPEAVAVDAGEVRGAVQALGESPIAALLGELGPDVQLYQKHITTLANPFFEGRAPGTAGNLAAADYLEFYLRRAGLEPIFPAEGSGEANAAPSVLTFRQTFRAGSPVIKVLTEALSLDLGAKGELPLQPGRDFNLLGSSGSGELARLPIAFAGYAIPEGPDGYSSFPGKKDLDGKIALVFRFEPMNDEGKSRWVQRGWSPNAGLDAKLLACAEQGAAAVLLVNPPGADDPRATEMMTTMGTIGGSRRMQIPIAMISPQIAERLVQAAEGSASLMDLRRRADEAGGVEDLRGVTATIRADVKRVPVVTDNIAGVLPGRGPLKDEYIVIGGHYDHVGYGPVGARAENMGKLHPGADDNASGTSGVLFLADKLAAAYRDLPAGAAARSIIFIGFSAEESGLNGSRYFVNNPPVPLEQIDLMINMDMIGRLRENKLDIDGVASAKGFYDWLKPYFEASGLNIKHGFAIPSNSDHYSFYAKKIPILSLFTGYHREYHMPADEWHLINAVGAVKQLDLVEKITLAAAQRPERLVFTPSRPPDQEGEEGEEPKPAPGPVAVKVRFGIAPGDYSDDEPGVLVGDVFDGTSAALAGIKVGDRMIRWNGKPLKDVAAWMPLLAQHNPGDVVDLVVVRDGQELTLKVTLQPRSEERK